MATINSMRNFKIQPRAIITITWLLTGMLFVGSLVNSSQALNSAVWAEERSVLEIDDDRSDFEDLGFLLCVQSDANSTSQTWQEVQVFYSALTSRIEFKANLQRGPPRC